MSGDLARLLQYVNQDGPVAADPALGRCWLWTSRVKSNGYGRAWFRGRVAMAHRAIYELLVGPIPIDMTLDHLCHNADATCPGGTGCAHRACVNPAHMDPVEQGANYRRSPNSASARTHCPQGHPYDKANTYRLPSRPTARYCRECNNERGRRRRAERRAAK